MNLHFNITNDHIKLMSLSDYPVSDSVNHLTAVFEFDEAWEGFTKTALFSNGNGIRCVLLENDECVIPWETLTGRFLYISVYGIKDSVRITATELKIPLAPSGYCEGETPEPPTPTVYEQLLERLSEVAQNSGNVDLSEYYTKEEIGNLNYLTTDSKSSLVDAVNELDERKANSAFVDATQTYIEDEVSRVESDLADEKRERISNDNMFINQIEQLSEKILEERSLREEADTAFALSLGNVDKLQTSNKSNLVGAINEVVNLGGGGSGEISDGSITTEKLADGAVTYSKLDDYTKSEISAAYSEASEALKRVEGAETNAAGALAECGQLRQQVITNSSLISSEQTAREEADAALEAMIIFETTNTHNTVISLSDKLDNEYYSKAEVDERDTGLATVVDSQITGLNSAVSALASALEWKLIGEAEITQEAIDEAGEDGVTAVTLDFGAPITEWYGETMIDITIPKADDLNSFATGRLRIGLGNSLEQSLMAVGGYCTIVAQQTASNLLNPTWTQNHIITSNWMSKKYLTHSLITYRGYSASAGYPINPYATSASYMSNNNKTAIGRRYLSVQGLSGNSDGNIPFKFPAKTKVSLYGRFE